MSEDNKKPTGPFLRILIALAFLCVAAGAIMFAAREFNRQQTLPEKSESTSTNSLPADQRD